MEQSLQWTSLFSHMCMLLPIILISSEIGFYSIGNEPIIANGVSTFGEEIKEKIGSKIWGMNEEGLLKQCYWPTGVSGLWFAPGAFQHSRFFSKHLVWTLLPKEHSPDYFVGESDTG
jgi:hypothetical protein